MSSDGGSVERVRSSTGRKRGSSSVTDDVAIRAIHAASLLRHTPPPPSSSPGIPSPPPDFNPEPDYPAPSPHHGIAVSPSSSGASSNGSSSSRHRPSGDVYFVNTVPASGSDEGHGSRRSDRSYSSLDTKGSEASETLNEARESLLHDEADFQRELENAKSSGSGPRRTSQEIDAEDDETRHAWDSVWPSQDVIAKHAASPSMRRTSSGEYEPVHSAYSHMSPPHSPTQRIFAFPPAHGSSGSSAGSSTGSTRTVTPSNSRAMSSPILKPISSSPTALRPQGYTHRRIMSQDRERERERRKIHDHEHGGPSAGEYESVSSIAEDEEGFNAGPSSPPPIHVSVQERRRRAISVSSFLSRPSSGTSNQPIDLPPIPPPIALPPSIVPAPPPPSLPLEDITLSAKPPSFRRANSADESRSPPVTGSPTLTRSLSLGKDSPKRSPTALASDNTVVRPREFPRRSPLSLPAIETSSPPVDAQELQVIESGSPRSFSLIEDPAEVTRRKREARKSPVVPTRGEIIPSSDSSALQTIETIEPVPTLLHIDLPEGKPAATHGSPPVDHFGISPPLLDEEEGEARQMLEQPAMDVSFDDEGLNTLERIFLLSKSDYPFHRAYVARSLGDLLLDVDPCETVEYIMPLLSGFTMDEDESVKEAFASEIHKILWFFFATCRLVSDDEVGNEDPDEEPGSTTVTMTSDGPSLVPATVALANKIDPRTWRNDGEDDTPDMSTAGSTISTLSVQTPSSVDVDATSPEDPETAHGSPKQPVETAPIINRPSISVHFFTPILGSMLLSQNNMVAEPARAAVVAIIARLQGKAQSGIDPWGPPRTDDSRRAYASQTGPHVHDSLPFSESSKQLVEHELVQGIILGMGKLDAEFPEQGYPQSSPRQDDGNDKHELQHDGNDYPSVDDEDEAAQFRYQLEQEATLGRAISINLIASVAEFYTGAEIADRGFIDPVLKSAGDELGVKTEAALALAYLAKVAPEKYIADMLPLFEHFATDDAVHVKQSACLCLPALCRRIESRDLRRTYAVNAITLLMESDTAVQLTVLEILGEIIYLFHDDPQGPPQELLQFFLAQDEPQAPNGWTDAAESERDIVTAFNFPAVALTLGGARWPELRERYLQLATNGQTRVKRSLAASIHEMSRILEIGDVGRDLVPFFRACLKDTEDIRERVYDHLDIFLEHAPPDLSWDICQCTARSWTAGTLGSWRIRERLAKHLPALFKLFKLQPGAALCLDIVAEALKDPFAAVRDAATTGVSVLQGEAEALPDRQEQLRSILLHLGNSSSFRHRQTFIRCVQNFIAPPPNQAAFEEYFLPALPRLLNDVIDIRIALARLLLDLFATDAFYGNDDAAVPESVIGLANSLAEDEHVDVRDLAKKLPFYRFRKSPLPVPGNKSSGASTGMTDMFDSTLRLQSNHTIESPSSKTNPFNESFSEAIEEAS